MASLFRERYQILKIIKISTERALHTAVQEPQMRDGVQKLSTRIQAQKASTVANTGIHLLRVFNPLQYIYIHITYLHIYFGIIINKCDFSPGTNSKSKRTHMRGGTSATKRQRTTQTLNQSHPSRLNIPCHTCAYIA